MKKLICFLTNHMFLGLLDYADEEERQVRRLKSCAICGGKLPKRVP